jgi:hypothetical protein
MAAWQEMVTADLKAELKPLHVTVFSADRSRSVPPSTAVREDVEIGTHPNQTKPLFVDVSFTLLAYFSDYTDIPSTDQDVILRTAYLYVSRSEEPMGHTVGGTFHLHSTFSSSSSTFSLTLDQHFRQLVHNFGALSYVATQRWAVAPAPLPWHFSALGSLQDFFVRFGGIVSDSSL